VCGDCEARLVEYHLKWWREAAEAATAELDELRIKYRKLSRAIEEPNRQVSASGPQAGPAAEQAETPPTGLLDQARKEIVELCGQFDAAVPYWRVKNCMDAFSDKLKSDERVLLAQEIGAAGSLIRWCTREIENLGWRVTNNPVHDDADTMMDAWTEDYYQTPQKSRWRRGRSR
jgi:hypothetical protein